MSTTTCGPEPAAVEWVAGRAVFRGALAFGVLSLSYLLFRSAVRGVVAPELESLKARRDIEHEMAEAYLWQQPAASRRPVDHRSAA